MDIPTNIKNLVDSFSAEINANVDILLAHDLTIDKTIIVDGTKRALALLLIKDEAPEVLNKIIEDILFLVEIEKSGSPWHNPR